MSKGDNNKTEIRSNTLIVILMFVSYDTEVQNKSISKTMFTIFFASIIDRYIWDVFTVDEIKTNNIYYCTCIYTFFVEI